MVSRVELLYGLREGGKGKEGRASAISNYVTPVQVEDILMCIEGC
jgi:hypothetical protein